jgi:hypothetical protein
VAEFLPLGIHRVDAAARENITLFDKPLPVDLVFVLFARVSTGDLKDFDELAHSKSSPLTLGVALVMLFIRMFRRTKWVTVTIIIMMPGFRRRDVFYLCDEIRLMR